MKSWITNKRKEKIIILILSILQALIYVVGTIGLGVFVALWINLLV